MLFGDEPFAASPWSWTAEGLVVEYNDSVGGRATAPLTIVVSAIAR